jgi:hypothetical protein
MHSSYNDPRQRIVLGLLTSTTRSGISIYCGMPLGMTTDDRIDPR